MSSAERALAVCALLAGALLPVSAGEFEVQDKLKVNGGVEISTMPGGGPLVFASSMASQGNVGIGTTAPAQKLSVAGAVESTAGGLRFPDGTTLASLLTPAVLQTRMYSDYTYRTTGNGGYYYFGAPGQYDNAITPLKQDSVLLISINYFGEPTDHNNHTRLQYSIGGGAWTDFDLVPYGSQQGTLKVGTYEDGDYSTTPHSYSTQVAKAFNTTQTIAFRMYHFNGGTFYHNASVSTTAESGPSTLILEELDAARCSYVKR